MKTIFKDLPIQKKLFLSFLLLILVPVVLIGIFTFMRSSEMVKYKTQQYSKSILYDTANNIENKLRSIEQISFQVISNSVIQNALYKANGELDNEFDTINTQKMIEYQLKSLINSNVDIAAIEVQSKSGMTVYVNPGSVTMDVSDEDRLILQSGNGSVHWFDTNPQNKTLMMGRTINSISNMESLGFVMIYLRESSIYRIINNADLVENSEYMIINDRGEILSYQDKNQIGKQNDFSTSFLNDTTIKNTFHTITANEKRYYTISKDIGGTPWRLASFIQSVEYEKDIILLRGWIIIICASCCLLSLVFSILLSKTISRPVIDLSKMMVKVGEGDFEVSSTYESKDEIGILSKQFNKMVNRVQQLIEEVYKEQLLKQKTELKFLRMQINPHFLYNTLESINWLARMEGVPEVGKMIKALGDLMRASISGDDLVSIEEEIKNINNYLMIQKLRYGEKVKTEINIKQDIAAFIIPKLTLQPIVENAIVHGIEAKEGNGNIVISADRLDGKVVISVKDDGVGMESDLAETILEQDFEGDKGDATHIGLKNVDRRIKMYYGKQYGLHIFSTPGEGTTIQILFPDAKIS